MLYASTRGGAKPAPFTDILPEGLAPDGGLFVPQEFPRLGAAGLAAMRGMSYRELAFAILARFADDIPSRDLKRLVDATYTKEIFCTEDITPLKKLHQGLYLLRPANAPSLAFKAIPLQLPPHPFPYAL